MVATGRRSVDPRVGPRPMLQELPDHHRVEDERDDPHRPAAGGAPQRVGLE